MRWQLSLARQFLLLQLGIVLLVVCAVAAVSLAGADAAFRRDQGTRLRSVAENLAANDTVRTGMRSATWADSLAAAAETARGVSGSSFAALADNRGILLTGPDRGRRATLGASDGLAGRAWLGVVTDGSRFLVAHAPVLDPSDGRVLGLAIVGKAYPSRLQLITGAIPDLLTYLLLGSALGIVGSWLLARRIKRQTLGLEPGEIAGLVEHREAMLHGIREGLIGVDAAGRVTLANDEAGRLLGLPADVAGQPLRSLGLGDELTALLTALHAPPQAKRPATDKTDHIVVHDSRVLVLNRMPVVVRGRAVGTVTTLRDRTELTALQRELDLSRDATETLRAQAHEFTNRLHTISGLIQLGQYDEAVSFILQAGRTHEALSHEVQSRIADPALAALLIAKASAAAELHVELVVTADSALPEPLAASLAADLVTVTGNLVDNAIDSAGNDPRESGAPRAGGGGSGGGGRVEVTVRRRAGCVEVVVHDSGPGVAPELADEVFRSGYTTKEGDGHRGLGLSLISRICTARGGAIEVSGSTFTARLPGEAGSIEAGAADS